MTVRVGGRKMGTMNVANCKPRFTLGVINWWMFQSVTGLTGRILKSRFKWKTRMDYEILEFCNVDYRSHSTAGSKILKIVVYYHPTCGIVDDFAKVAYRWNTVQHCSFVSSLWLQIAYKLYLIRKLRTSVGSISMHSKRLIRLTTLNENYEIEILYLFDDDSS